MGVVGLEIRRLDAAEDEALIREAVRWINDQPRFFRDCEKVWGRESAEDYLDQMRTEPQADVGVFDGREFIAVITISLKGKGLYESHLMAKRGARAATIELAVANVLSQMFQNGMRQGWLWVAARNVGVKRMVKAVGMRRDGLEIINGQSHGRLIEWQRYAIGVG